MRPSVPALLGVATRPCVPPLLRTVPAASLNGTVRGGPARTGCSKSPNFYPLLLLAQIVLIIFCFIPFVIALTTFEVQCTTQIAFVAPLRWLTIVCWLFLRDLPGQIPLCATVQEGRHIYHHNRPGVPPRFAFAQL